MVAMAHDGGFSGAARTGLLAFVFFCQTLLQRSLFFKNHARFILAECAFSGGGFVLSFFSALGIGVTGMKKSICKIVLVLFSLMPVLSWAENITVHIQVKGMTCPLCVSMINKALNETDGVVKAKTSLKENKAVVIVPEGFDTDVLLKAIEETGYSGEIEAVKE